MEHLRRLITEICLNNKHKQKKTKKQKLHINITLITLIQNFVFPPDVGYPLDETNGRFYLMETHYSDTEPPKDLESLHAAPVISNDGLKLYYTSALRKHDAGVLSIGKFEFVFSLYNKKKMFNKIQYFMYVIQTTVARIFYVNLFKWCMAFGEDEIIWLIVPSVDRFKRTFLCLKLINHVLSLSEHFFIVFFFHLLTGFLP